MRRGKEFQEHIPLLGKKWSDCKARSFHTARAHGVLANIKGTLAIGNPCLQSQIKTERKWTRNKQNWPLIFKHTHSQSIFILNSIIYLLPFSQSFSISAFRSCSFCRNSFFSFSIFFFVSSRFIVTSWIAFNISWVPHNYSHTQRRKWISSFGLKVTFNYHKLTLSLENLKWTKGI